MSQESKLEEMARGMMRSACMTKDAACARRAGGRADLSPMVDVLTEQGKRIIVTIPLPQVLPDALRASAPEEEVGRPRFIALISDNYGLDDALPHETYKGAATQAFMAGDPRAYEALSLALIDCKTGALRFAEARYTYNRNGRPEFADVRFRDEEAKGTIPDALREAAGL